jgi:hypothetical protein
MTEDFRPVPGFDGYVVNRHGDVWSIGRVVAAKRGTRTTVTKQLKPDKGRVALRRDGKTVKCNIRELVAGAFPPTRHYTSRRWVTLTCSWCHQDYRDTTHSWCENTPTMWPDLHRCPHCTTAVNALPADYFPTPA